MTDRNGDNDNEEIMIRRMEMTVANRVAVFSLIPQQQQHASLTPIIRIITMMRSPPPVVLLHLHPMLLVKKARGSQHTSSHFSHYSPPRLVPAAGSSEWRAAPSASDLLISPL